MAKKKEKEVKLWNVRGQRMRGRGSMYIGAYNRSHASRLILHSLSINESDKSKVKEMNRELRDYGNEGCWGNDMEKLVPIPEVGVWEQKEHNSPIVRLC
jgi:hypothetical protein